MTARTSALCGLAVLAATSAVMADTADPRGPIEYPGMKAVADEQGVQVRGYTFRNECNKPSPWQARWIWLSGAESPPVAIFHKEITLAEAPQRVAAWLTADTKYRLYVNGRLASRGPVDIGLDYGGGNTGRWFYDYRDLTPLFTKKERMVSA